MDNTLSNYRKQINNATQSKINKSKNKTNGSEDTDDVNYFYEFSDEFSDEFSNEFSDDIDNGFSDDVDYDYYNKVDYDNYKYIDYKWLQSVKKHVQHRQRQQRRKRHR